MKTKHLLLILAVASVGGIVFATAGYRENNTARLARTTEVQQSLIPSRRVQIVRFTLYDVGIYPQEAHASQGAVTISIEDLTGSSSGLSIERIDTTERLFTGVVNKLTNSLRARAELLLPAGRYELTDASRRDNRALLIVEP